MKNKCIKETASGHRNGKRGASIAVALFILLTCAVVAAIVISASSVSAGLLSNTEKKEKACMMVSSAAQDIAADMSFFEMERTDDGTLEGDVKTSRTAQGIMSDVLKAVQYRMAPYEEPDAQEFSLEISFTENGEEYAVGGTLHIGTDYSILAELDTVTVAGKDVTDNDYCMTVEVPAAKTEWSEDRLYICWGEAEVKEAGE